MSNSINNGDQPLLGKPTQKTIADIIRNIFSWITPALFNRLVQIAQSGVLTHVIVRQSAVSGAANTFIVPLNNISRTFAQVSASYFTPELKKILSRNPEAPLSILVQQALIIQMINSAASAGMIGLFIGVYKGSDNPELSQVLWDYYKIALLDIPFFAARSLMNNVLIATDSKNWVPVFSAGALALNVGSFVLLNRYKMLSMMTIPAVSLGSDAVMLALQLLHTRAVKKLKLFERNSLSDLRENFWKRLTGTTNMSLQSIAEVLLGIADALLIGRLGLVNQNLWNVMNSFLFLFYSFGIDISRTLATIINSYETKKEKWICYGLCKLLGLSIVGMGAGLLFSPLQEKTVKLFLPRELFNVYEERHKEMNHLLLLMCAVLTVELQSTIAKGLLRGLSVEEIPWMFKATMGALYGLELPLMLIAAFAFNANVFTFLALWLVGAAALDIAVETRTFKLLNPTRWGSFFRSPLSLQEDPTQAPAFSTKL